MHIQIPILRLSAILSFTAGLANAAYTIEDTYNVSNFFNEFTFFSGNDPTNGFVKFATESTANISGLAGYADNAVYLGVDHTTVNPPGGRAATRVTSNKAYTHGLFIADVTHMPVGCGTWPAYWLLGTGTWPANGEIDIIEGVNQYATNAMTLHTSSGCTMSSTGVQPGSVLQNPNCNAGNANTGCSTSTENTQSYGAGFNANNGGVYAMEWTSTAIQVFFFTRTSIPADITSGSPDPSTWGAPMASFTGGSSCDIDSHFKNHNIIFDTTFCGDWAGDVWANGTCGSLAPTCEAYVAQNPTAFTQAFWTIESVKVYQEATAAGKRGVPVAFTG